MCDKATMVLEINSKEDRATLAAILTTNGYTVQPCKVKKSKTGIAQGLEIWREQRVIDGRAED